MKKHVTVVGAIQIGFGILGLIGAVAFSLHSNLPKACAGEEVPGNGSGFPVSKPASSYRIPVNSGLVGGMACCYRSWARYLVIVVAALGCLNIPIGTLKGVYSLWVLLQDETIKFSKINKLYI